MEDKIHSAKEVAVNLLKAIHHSVKKAMDNPTDQEASKEIVEDVLDPNQKRDTKPSDVPVAKDGVLWKNKIKKSSIEKLQVFVNTVKNKKKPNL